jgi:hypothetical protein
MNTFINTNCVFEWMRRISIGIAISLVLLLQTTLSACALPMTHPIEPQFLIRLEFVVVNYNTSAFNLTHYDLILDLNVTNAGTEDQTVYLSNFYALFDLGNNQTQTYQSTTKGGYLLRGGRSLLVNISFRLPSGVMPTMFSYRPQDAFDELKFPLIKTDTGSGEKEALSVWDMIIISLLGAVFFIILVLIYLITSQKKKRQRRFQYFK